MTIRVFFGNKSEHPHEIRQQQEIIDILNAESPCDIDILLNFNVWDNVEIDCALLTEYGIVILELKSIRGKIYGSPNGEWIVTNNLGKDRPLSKNLIQQLSKERFNFNKTLVKIAKKIIPDIPEKESRKPRLGDILRTEVIILAELPGKR